MRETVIDALMKIGVNARSYFYPVHMMPAYRHLPTSLPLTETIALQRCGIGRQFTDKCA